MLLRECYRVWRCEIKWGKTKEKFRSPLPLPVGFTLYLLLQSIWQLPSRAEQETTPVNAAVMEQMLEFAPLKLKFIISGLKLLMGVKMGTR